MVALLTAILACPSFGQAEPSAENATVPRRLAPGVMVTIPSDIQATDTVSQTDSWPDSSGSGFDFAKTSAFAATSGTWNSAQASVRMIWLTFPRRRAHEATGLSGICCIGDQSRRRLTSSSSGQNLQG